MNNYAVISAHWRNFTQHNAVLTSDNTFDGTRGSLDAKQMPVAEALETFDSITANWLEQDGFATGQDVTIRLNLYCGFDKDGNDLIVVQSKKVQV